MKALSAALLAATVMLGHPAPAEAFAAQHRPARAPRARAKPDPAPAPEVPAAPGGEAAVVPAPAELAQWFPKETTSFVELDDVAGALDASGSAAPLRQLLAWVASEMRAGSEDAASRLDAGELRVVLSSAGAFGEFPAPGAGARPQGAGRRNAGRGAPAARSLQAGIIRMKSAQTLARLRPRLVATTDGRLAKAGPATAVRVGGVSVDVVAAENRPEAAAYATIGKHLVMGTVASVSALLSGLTRPREQTLAARADFASASGRLGERRAVFGLYLLPDEDPSALSSIPEEMREDFSAHELETMRRGAERRERFFGSRALKSIAFAGRGGDAGLTVQVLFNLDLERPGLLTTLARMPAVGLRSADFVPAGAELFWSAGLDMRGLYALLADPDAAAETYGSMFGVPRPELLPEIDRTLMGAHGVSLKDDVLGAFGNEVALATGVAEAAPGSTAGPAKFAVAVAEVRRPEVLRVLIQRFNDMLPADSAERVERSEYRGAEVWRFGDRSWAMIDGYAVGGPTGSVELALDAHATGATLAAGAAFAQTARGAPKTLGAAFMVTSGYVARLFGGTITAISGAQPVEALLGGGGVVGMVSHEPAGVLLEVELKPGVLAAAAAAAGPRASSAEAEAVGTLRAFGSAEATFYASNGRYGRPDELVAAQLIDEPFGGETVRNGYRFDATVSVGGQQADEFRASAVPERYGDDSKRSFLMTEDFVIRAADHAGAPALPEDPGIGEGPAPDLDTESPSLRGLVPIVDVLFALGSPTHRNRLIVGSVYELYHAQQEHVRRAGRVGSFEELETAGDLGAGGKGFGRRNGYRFEFKSVPAADGRGESFAVTATPTAYAPGSLSFFLSPTSGLRAADKAGAEATAADPRHGDPDGTEGDGVTLSDDDPDDL